MKYIRYASGEQPLSKHWLQMERHLFDRDVIGCVQEDIVVFAENAYLQMFWSEEDINRLIKDGEKLLNPENAKKSIRESIKSYEQYWPAANNLLNKSKNSNNEEIAKAYSEYIYYLRRVYAHFATTNGITPTAVENELKRILSEKVLEKAKDFLEILTTPEKQDILLEELKEWRKVAEKQTKEDIVNHSKKYSILNANTFSEEQVLEFSKTRLNEKTINELDQEIEDSEKRRKEIKHKQEEIFKKLNSKKVEDLSWWIREGAIVRLLLKSCWNGESYYLLPFFKKIAEIANCSIRDIYMFYTPPEVVELLKNNNKVLDTELNNRKKCYLLYFNNQKISLYSGENALEMKKELLEESIPQEVKTFNGTVANKGKFIGKVKLIKVENPTEIQLIGDTLTKEHILVAGMTNPTMVPLMRKVSGIITDEGGMACHAAIISREFNLPAIVGTRIATHVLKDGENVELDANKGIITRLDM
jgi:phosphoenolpyruvate synthase/pyruvate phosphate dikinase